MCIRFTVSLISMANFVILFSIFSSFEKVMFLMSYGGGSFASSFRNLQRSSDSILVSTQLKNI